MFIGSEDFGAFSFHYLCIDELKSHDVNSSPCSTHLILTGINKCIVRQLLYLCQHEDIYDKYNFISEILKFNKFVDFLIICSRNKRGNQIIT